MDKGKVKSLRVKIIFNVQEYFDITFFISNDGNRKRFLKKDIYYFKQSVFLVDIKSVNIK